MFRKVSIALARCAADKLSYKSRRKREELLNVIVFDTLVSENMASSNIGWTSVAPDKVWLSSGFRVMLIKMGIDKAGSVNQLGRELGYRSRVHPGWSIRQILVGKQPFPMDRLRAISSFLEYPLEEIMRHQTNPKSVTVENTRRALEANGMAFFIPR